MKKVVIKNLAGDQTHGAEMEDPTQWIADCEASGVWGDPADYTIEIHDVTFDHELDLCVKSRVAEYPDLGDFLNAFFDGGEPALAELQAKRLAVKAKYPKPIQGGN
jgi:hypothetical protein